MEKIMSILSNNKDLIIEIFRTSPAWIALVISVVSPILYKKIELEKSKANFLFSKRFDIFQNYFGKLYIFRNSIINLISILLYHIEHSEFIDLTDVNTAKENLYNIWNDIKLSESCLWLLSDYKVLKLKGSISKSTKIFFQKIDLLSQNGVLKLNEQSIKELIELAKNTQNSIAEILNEFRKEMTIDK